MKCKVISFVSLCLLSNHVHASFFEKHFTPPPVKEIYLDIAVDRSKYGYDSYTTIGPGYINPGVFKHYGDSISVGLGVIRVNNFASQASYTETQNFQANFDGLNVKQSLSSIFVDAIYFYSLLPRLEVKPLYGFGVLFTDYETTYQENNHTYIQNERNTLFGLRFGVGLRYKFTQHFAGNIDYKYQHPFDKIKYISGASLSLSYIF